MISRKKSHVALPSHPSLPWISAAFLHLAAALAQRRHRRGRYRRGRCCDLRMLSPHQLRDIGLSREAALKDAGRPFRYR